MLGNTFIHLPNFGPKRERKLWDQGVITWDDFLSCFGSSQYHKDWCSTIASSDYALKSLDPDFFSQTLPRDEMWRCFPHFSKIAYLDIETTGLSSNRDYMTVVGIYDGKETKSYIHGKNMDEFSPELAKYDAVVTFNGSLFDLPFIRKSIDGVKIPPIQIDLRFVLSSLGIRGGLKKIEKQFNFNREDDLDGLTGYDAVKLWRKYMKRNDNYALDLLVRYNAADVDNLEKLMKWAYDNKREATGFDEILTKAKA
jgi:uncharacterized protein YprB with RNaseH-like and TPR domain